MPATPVSLFFAYSRKDQDLMLELANHLAPLKRCVSISSWHDGHIIPGDDWKAEIERHLESAQIILLLISADFINSNFCYDVELKTAIERHQAGTAWVVPIILRKCLWQKDPILGRLQALPKDGIPVKLWPDRDDVFTHIAEAIDAKIQQWRQAEYAANLLRYEQAFAEAVQRAYPLPPTVVARLKDYQQAWGLQAEDVTRVEQPIRDAAEAKLRKQAEAAQRRQAEVKAERRRQAEAAQRQREAEERHQKQQDYYRGGLYHLAQGNYPQAIADFQQAERYGHPEAQRRIAEAERQRQAAEDDLSSEKGVDYTRLRDLLKAKDWRAADRETWHRMLEVVGRQPGDYIREKELLNFPCVDLRTIDRLWVNYSQGKFGFSVQKQIWQECGSPKTTGKDWDRFCIKVGWQDSGATRYLKYDELKANPDFSPTGEFPLSQFVAGFRSVFLGGFSCFWGSLLSHNYL